MKIANILSKDTVIAPKEFNIIDSLGEAIVELPTLIVGYDYVNKNYPDFDITDISLGGNLFWTFKRTEKRDKYEEDLNWFIQKAYKNLVKEIIYIFVDPLQHQPKTLIKIIRKIYSLPNITTYVNDRMCYIYSEKLVFGIDLKLIKFVGLNLEKVLQKIKNISGVFTTREDLLKEDRRVIQLLGNKDFYIPFLIYLRGL
jgi:hypothetical protein